MSTRRISKVAVIGSGIMGSGIACHFANIGVEVLLLDVVPNELTEKEKAKGLKLSDPDVLNRIVDGNLSQAIKSNPAPLYHMGFKKRINTGNLSDDTHSISPDPGRLAFFLHSGRVMHRAELACVLNHMCDNCVRVNKCNQMQFL